MRRSKGIDITTGEAELGKNPLLLVWMHARSTYNLIMRLKGRGILIWGALYRRGKEGENL